MIKNLKEWMYQETTLMVNSADTDAKKHLYLNAFSAAQSITKAAEVCPDITFEELRNVVIDLLFQKPLSPIEDVEESWRPMYEVVTNNRKVYQCVRYPSLYKEMHLVTGEVRHMDSDRYICVDINNPNRTWTGGIGARILEEMCPITFPYMPDDMPIKVYMEEFAYHKSENIPEHWIDTMGITYFRMPDGKMIEVNRFFKAAYPRESSKTQVIPGSIEIPKREYLTRKAAWENRLKKEAKDED